MKSFSIVQRMKLISSFKLANYQQLKEIKEMVEKEIEKRKLDKLKDDEEIKQFKKWKNKRNAIIR